MIGVGAAERPLRCYVYEANNTTLVGELTTAIAGMSSYQTVLVGGFGSGDVAVPLFRPMSDGSAMELNPEAAWLTKGRLVRFVDGGTLRFTGQISTREQTSVEVSGYPGMTLTVRMSGLGSEWDDAVLPPDPMCRFTAGSVRRFGWMSSEATISGLSAPTVQRPVIEQGEVMPQPWVDLFGAVFSASTNRFFVLDDTTDTEKLVCVHIAAADRVTCYTSAEMTGQTGEPPASAWTKTHRLQARIPAGTTRWAFRVEGLPDNPNPRWTATCFEIDDPEHGSMSGETIRWRTGYSTGVTLYPWKAAASPWGVTVKQILRSVLAQVQAEQGVMVGWSIGGGDDTIDANGNALDLIPEVTFQLGAKLGSRFLTELVKSWCDIEFDWAAKQVLVYRWRERGTFATAPSLSSVPVFADTRFSPVTGAGQSVMDVQHKERTP